VVYKILLTCFLITTFSFNAYGTTMLYKNLEELVDESDHIIGGTVGNIQSKKYKDELIYTEITINNNYLVTEAGTIKQNNSFKIRYLGGKVPIYGTDQEVIGMENLEISGTPTIKLDDRIIFFIKDNGISEMPIYGMHQGFFLVDENENIRDSNSNSIVGLDGAHFVRNIRNNIVSDRFITTRFSDNKNDSIISLTPDKNSNVNPVHISSFLSIIQERKAIIKNKTGKEPKNLSTLFSLPPVITNSVEGTSVKDISSDKNINFPVFEKDLH